MKKLLSIVFYILTGFSFAQTNLPVKDPRNESYPEMQYSGVRNLLSIEQIHSCMKTGSADGLIFDMTGITNLLDGSEIDPSRVYGFIYSGPYPFESHEVQYAYHRFRLGSKIENGKGALLIDYLLQPGLNSEEWIDRGTVIARLELYCETDTCDRNLGIYDTYVSFKKEDTMYIRTPSIIEGPFVNMVTSDDPQVIVISFQTDVAVIARVVLNDKAVFVEKQPTTKHEISITGLHPDKHYEYCVQIGENKTKSYTFKSAPLPGKGKICFAYVGDTREGHGGIGRTFMGINRTILDKIANLIYLKGTDFFLVGGDLINGYTTIKDDFINQLYFWKQTLAGFWHMRPVYTGMGNHEALLRVFDDGTPYGISLDRWPYETESAEAVFAQEFVHPRNGPRVSDKRRPTYTENVYSFQYGPVKVIAFNNNYWVSYQSGKFGGAPEGYIMDDQLSWIIQELEKAEKNPTIKYIVLFAQEPVFPNSVHYDDAMWYDGNNNIRAYTYIMEKRTLVAENKGIIDIRNDLVRAVSHCKKVAAVLGADEHSYSKIMINNTVPIGVPKTDDTNSNGKLGDTGETYSNLSDLQYPTWYFSAGDAGAPYYAEVETPWNRHWKIQNDTEHYLFSSQDHILIFTADEQKISLTVYNPYGEIIDGIENLMTIKE
ncbi:hypothetical protein AMJ52_00790 [candidate division TA06 bacterium DG_78]|uniref:Calcineurin-like phosphoesterase domain-containing protein n=1 Tax=candidate division TA06 bacterium DG_78 TaxID=1703772 RepID=A0A0S7YIV8_UNCT6|nr:MAG: hypothetical protein AMJ52_00790 [candidate division TA06 bacterium DG_78]